MVIPEASHPMWADILLGRRPADFESVGARMLMVRLGFVLRLNRGSTTSVARCCSDLHNYLISNLEVGSVQGDLRKLGL